MNATVVTPESDLAAPDTDIRAGAILALLFFVGVLGWAAFVRLDAAAYGTGSIAVSGRNQAVQHRDGGVVGTIHVREGQRVRQGDILIRLNAADVAAEERSLSAQAIRLFARRARLEAEIGGAARLSVPAEFASLASEDRPAARAALQLQQNELNARRSLLAAQQGAISSRVAQAGGEGEGYRRQSVATAEQLRLIRDELASLRPLAERGFVAVTRIRALERAEAELEGRRGQLSASVGQTADQAQEQTLARLSMEREFRERTLTELREVETTLGDVLPRLNAARVQLARTLIRAPATGTVVGLTVFTPGGVIAAGQQLMNIVPTGAPLRLQARMSPADADDLAVGQRVMVRLIGISDRSLPSLEGRLTRVSADSLTDERTGESYFSAEVDVPPSQLALIRDVRGPDFELRPGMPAEIIVPLRARTALQYLVEPLVGGFWRSFREQ